MATTFLAILIVLLAARAAPDLARLREFRWLGDLLGSPSRDAGESARARFPVALLPLIAFALCVLVQVGLAHVLFGLPAFAFAVAVLYFCWGPRDLDVDVDAVLAASDGERRHAAAQALRPDPAVAPLPLEAGALVEATFRSALSRWFGVLFWFVVLGPAGALGYRLVQLLARNLAFAPRIEEEQRELLERAARILDWAPAHLVALTLALVSDFDAVMTNWRGYHAAHGKGYFTLDLGFLGSLAHAGIDADVAAGDGYSTDTQDPLAELADARKVLRRILVAWVAILAICVIAGWSL